MAWCPACAAWKSSFTRIHLYAVKFALAHWQFALLWVFSGGFGNCVVHFEQRTQIRQKWFLTAVTSICCASVYIFRLHSGKIELVAISEISQFASLRNWRIGMLPNWCALRNSITTWIIALANHEMKFDVLCTVDSEFIPIFSATPSKKGANLHVASIRFLRGLRSRAVVSLGMYKQASAK
jgi:hypothetical protein